ncbi:MAG: epoxyqueuosine reductase, partial [Microcoleus sp.]
MKKSINSDLIKQKSRELGFHKVGIASADADFDREKPRLQAWLDKGYQADMAWMANPKRLDIRSAMPDVQSVICVAINYYTPHQRPGGSEYAKISRYGWGRDYHKIL